MEQGRRFRRFGIGRGRALNRPRDVLPLRNPSEFSDITRTRLSYTISCWYVKIFISFYFMSTVIISSPRPIQFGCKIHSFVIYFRYCDLQVLAFAEPIFRFGRRNARFFCSAPTFSYNLDLFSFCCKNFLLTQCYINAGICELGFR